MGYNERVDAILEREKKELTNRRNLLSDIYAKRFYGHAFTKEEIAYMDKMGFTPTSINSDNKPESKIENEIRRNK